MGSCLGGCISCVCCQYNFMIFPAPRCSYNQQSHGEYLQFFENENKDKVPYMHMPYKNSKMNIIFFHGNAQDIGYSVNFLAPIRQRLKCTIYAIKYPNYGQYNVLIPARLSNKIKSDSLQFFQYLARTKPVTRNNTLIMGRSIGSGGACYLASQKNFQHLALISPFSSIPKVATDYVGCIGNLVKCHFDNLEEIAKFRGKLLVIHGKVDQVIGWRHGEMVVEQYQKNDQVIGWRHGQMIMGQYLKKSRKEAVFVSPQYMSHNYFNFEKDILLPIIQFTKQIAKQQMKQ